MKRLKENQLGHFCSYCEPRTTRATLRQDYWRGLYACEQHKSELFKKGARVV